MKKLTEVEWITRFEQVQGRRPTPEELYKAHQEGLIAPKKNRRNLILLAGALLALLIAIGIMVTVNRLDNNTVATSDRSSRSEQSSSQRSSSQSSQESSTSREASSVSSSTDAIQAPDANHASEAYSEAEHRWNSDKASRLASLMVTWGNSMNQPGYKEITSQAQNLPIQWYNDQPLNYSYAASGLSDAEYTIVAVYERWESVSVHRYFFTIKSDGTAFVLYSATTNGGVYKVKETENADLKAGYAQIVGN